MATPRHSASQKLTIDVLATLSPVPPDHRSPYGIGPEQFGELYLPPGAGPHPVMILLHGGCWRAEYGLTYMGQLCAAFAQEGFAVWNVEYRRLGNGGGWPTTFEDAVMGAEHLRGMAATFSLDLARIIAVGHSAGGHLALWLAGRHRLPKESPLFSADPLPIHGVVSLAGIPDLIEGVKQNICRGACQELMGGLPEEVPQRYQQASPIALLPLGVPQWHVVGRCDERVPAGYIEPYIAMAKRHDHVHLDILPHAGHFEPVVPTTAAWPVIKQAAHTLLSKG